MTGEYNRIEFIESVTELREACWAAYEIVSDAVDAAEVDGSREGRDLKRATGLLTKAIKLCEELK